MFTSLAEVDTLRAATYRYHHTSLPASSASSAFSIPSVLIISREAVHGNLPGRAITNLDKVRAFFAEQHHRYQLVEKKLELLTPAEQIQVMVHTDIFVGALGSGFANVVFMLPGSVAISYSPPHVGGFFFDTLSEMAGIHYIPVFNSSTPFPPECHKRINANGESTIRACLDVLYANNIYMDVEQLAYLLDAAIIHLRSEKYRVM